MPAFRIIKNATFDCFKAALEARLPMFQQLTDKSLNNLGSGFTRRAWEWRFYPFLTFFIAILYPPDRAEFFLEGAWSEKARFPTN